MYSQLNHKFYFDRYVKTISHKERTALLFKSNYSFTMYSGIPHSKLI